MSETQTKVDAIAERHKASEQNKQSIQALRQSLERSLPELQKALPKTLVAEQFVRVLLTTAQSSPLIARCVPQSVLRAAFEGAALGLMIDGVLGHAYLVPYKNGKTGTMEAQLQIGYRGFCELAYRSGLIGRISARVVHEHDVFEVVDGTAPSLVFQKRLQGDRGQPIAAFAVAFWARSNHVPPSFEVLTADDIEARRKRSRSADKTSSPWVTDPDAMWAKSAIRALAKTLPQCPEIARAALVDEIRETQSTPVAHLTGSADIEPIDVEVD